MNLYGQVLKHCTIRHAMTRLLHYFVALDTHSSFVKERVGSDTESDVEERDGYDDIQGELSTGNIYGEPQESDILMLCEDDIPGSSLNGKNPKQLNIQQLKRWLACRGAPVSGKKPELIER